MQKRSDKDHRVQITESQLRDAEQTVEFWLRRRLDEKGWGAWVSRHEILGFLTEEYTEMTEAVHSKSEQEIRAELVDIAVGCEFAIACINADALDW